MSIFEEDWWLDAACDGAWDKVEVRWDGKVVGSMPFFIENRLGLRWIKRPPYTHALNPHFDLPSSKPIRRLKNQTKVLRSLLEMLPDHDKLTLLLDPGSDAIYSFVNLNYAAEPTYVFCSDRDTDIDALLLSMDQKTRNVIRTTQNRFTVEFSTNIERYLPLSDKQSYSTLCRLFDACKSRDRAIVLSIIDSSHRVLGAAILIRDDSNLYFWLSAYDKGAGNGVVSLMVWEALQKAKELGLCFDTTGYGDSRTGDFLSQFGLNPTVRFLVQSRVRLRQAVGHVLMEKLNSFVAENFKAKTWDREFSSWIGRQQKAASPWVGVEQPVYYRPPDVRYATAWTNKTSGQT